MSSRYSSSSRDSSSRRDSRRRSPGPSSSRRSPSPKPKPRDANELPESFGRIAEDVPEDESNVLQRMKKNFGRSPLGAIVKCIEGNRKIKIWTRNFKEVRGICTGYVQCFDKHWNIMMTDVDEVYLKPKRAKTPFLHDVKSAEGFKELPKKEPRKKKDAAGTEKDAESAEQENVPPTPKEAETPKDSETEKSSNPEGEKKKKKRRKRAKNAATTTKRHVKQMFVRGDNIVMCAVLGEEDD